PLAATRFPYTTRFRSGARECCTVPAKGALNRHISRRIKALSMISSFRLLHACFAALLLMVPFSCASAADIFTVRGIHVDKTAERDRKSTRLNSSHVKI